MVQTAPVNKVTLNVNGHDHVIDAPPDSMLLYALRDNLGLRGPKFGCGLSECGACTVIMNGSADPFLHHAALHGRRTRRSPRLKGSARRNNRANLQQAFIDEQAAQCGYCIGGMIMTAQAFLEQNPHPTRDDIKQALDGNLCRCGTHMRIRPRGGARRQRRTGRRCGREAMNEYVRNPQPARPVQTLGRPRRRLQPVQPGRCAGREQSGGGARPIPGGVPPDAGELSAWLAVHPDDTVTLFTGKVDVGTGAETALAQIAAEELYFPIDRLNVVMGTTSETVNQGPSYGSRTIRYAGPQIRHAAAAGRRRCSILRPTISRSRPSALPVENGIISVQAAPHRSISYGELVDGKSLTMEIGATGKSFDMVVAPQAQLKDPATYTVVGTSVSARTSRRK